MGLAVDAHAIGRAILLDLLEHRGVRDPLVVDRVGQLVGADVGCEHLGCSSSVVTVGAATVMR